MPAVAEDETVEAVHITAMRLVGKVSWLCPDCKDVNVHRVKGDSIALQCGACRHVFLFGLCLEPSLRGRHRKYHLKSMLAQIPSGLLAVPVPVSASL